MTPGSKASEPTLRLWSEGGDHHGDVSILLSPVALALEESWSLGARYGSTSIVAKDRVLPGHSVGAEQHASSGRETPRELRDKEPNRRYRAYLASTPEHVGSF